MSRYSQIYIESGKPTVDSKRARNRLCAFLQTALLERSQSNALVVELLRIIEIRTGADTGNRNAPPWHRLIKFVGECQLRDLLDFVTLFYTYCTSMRISAARPWLVHTAEVFQEENLPYRVDENGIVHPFVDSEFEVNRAAAIGSLAESQFQAARAEFEDAFRHLRDGEGKQAIRMMFPAVETAAKVLFPGNLTRLMPNEIDRYLRPRMEAKYAGNKPAINAAHSLLESFKSWITASQQYRHGQEVQEHAEPPTEFVVSYLSAGATFLRWMIELAG